MPSEGYAVVPKLRRKSQLIVGLAGLMSITDI